MKKFLLGFAKLFLAVLVATLLVIAVTIVTAIVWPLPHISTPDAHDTILIQSVAVVDVKTGRLLKDQDVLLEKNKIKALAAAGTLDTGDDVFGVDGSGKYLMPGLWNMHSHSTQYSPWMHHPLLIANGVTGVRELSGQLHKKDSYWAGSRERLLWGNELRQNRRVSPRYIFQSSFQLDGAASVPDSFPEYFKLQSPGDVEPVLRFYQKEGVDLLKVYFEIPPDTYRELARQAGQFGMHLAGHKPMFVELEEAIRLGQRSFEHARIFMYECSPVAEELRRSHNYKKIYSDSKRLMVDACDLDKVSDLMHLMHEHQSYWTPTLQTLKVSAFAEHDNFINNPNKKYITTLRRKLLWDFDIGHAAKDNVSEAKKGINLAFYKAAQAQVGLAVTHAVPIMAGTDVTDSNIFAGFSLHTELSDLVESGLSPLQALQSATLTPAKYAGRDKDFGSVEVGKMADLVLLDRNPLENIQHTQGINAVFLNGIYYDTEKLAELKQVTENLASAWHMNIKFVYSFFASPLMRKQLAD